MYSYLGLSIYVHTVDLTADGARAQSGAAPGDDDEVDWKLALAEFGDGERANLEMHLEAVIVQP
jgi:hypothetical protein